MRKSDASTLDIAPATVIGPCICALLVKNRAVQRHLINRHFVSRCRLQPLHPRLEGRRCGWFGAVI